MRNYLFLFGLFFVWGCASQPNKLPSTYIDSSEYEDENCKELTINIEENRDRMNKLFNILKERADTDETQTGVGLIIFWPTLFFLDGDESEEAFTYQRMKGEYNGRRVQMKKQDCDVSDFPVDYEHRLFEQYEAEKKAEKKPETKPDNE